MVFPDILQKRALLCSLCLVWSVYISLFIQGTDAFQVVKPRLTIRFFEGETVSEKTVSRRSVKENEIKSLSERLQKFNDASTKVLKTSSTKTKSSTSTPLNNSENEKDFFKQMTFFGAPTNEGGENKSESTYSEKTDAGEPSDVMEIPEPCAIDPFQVSRIYFKAISTLIQHVIDAMFFTNETPLSSRPGEGPTFEDGDFESVPSRNLIKRNAQIGTELVNSTNTNDAYIQADTHTDPGTTDTHLPASPKDKVNNSKTKISETEMQLVTPADLTPKNVHLSVAPKGEVNVSVSNLLNTGKSSSYNRTIINPTTKSTETGMPHLPVNSTLELDTKNVQNERKQESAQGIKEESSTSTSTSHGLYKSQSSKQSNSPKITIYNEKGAKINLQHEMVSNKDLIKSAYPAMLYDQAPGGKQDRFHDSHHTDSTKVIPRFVEHSTEVENDGQETSGTSIAFTATVTLLAVIVLAAIGTAAGYAYVWKTNANSRPDQHTGPGSSSQRSDIA